MSEFNLEEFKAGRNAISRDGQEFRFVAYVPGAVESSRLIALKVENRTVFTFYDDGRFFNCFRDGTDLIRMAPKPKRKVTLWCRTSLTSNGDPWICQGLSKISVSINHSFTQWLDPEPWPHTVEIEE